MTQQTATTFMRWVIVLSLFAAVIYQSGQIVELKHQLVEQDRLVVHQLVSLTESDQQYAALAKACLK
jgi:hypothetical protein